MSYLNLASGISDFAAATISLWFRAPQTAMQAVADAYDAETAQADAEGGASYVFSRLAGILPLMVWGPSSYEGFNFTAENVDPYTYHGYDVSQRSDCSYSPVSEQIHSPYTGYYTRWTKGNKILTNPSYIGVNCIRDPNTGEINPTLDMRIQMDAFGSGDGLWGWWNYIEGDFIQLINGSFPPCGPVKTLWGGSLDTTHCLTYGYYPGGDWPLHIAWGDQSDLFIQNGGPEAFLITQDIAVEPNAWHHVLISFNLGPMTASSPVYVSGPAACDGSRSGSISGSFSLNSNSKMYIAFDDRNISYTDQYTELPDNQIATPNAFYASRAQNETIPFDTFWYNPGLALLRTQDMPPIPTYSYSPGLIPVHGHPLGIPATPQFASKIHHVEMAELQMFTGITLATSNESVRRLFVDAKGKPVDPKVSAKALGKPNILLHGTSDWIKGKNTGTGGQFTPMGKIKKYTPDPTLHGPQGAPQLAKV